MGCINRWFYWHDDSHEPHTSIWASEAPRIDNRLQPWLIHLRTFFWSRHPIFRWPSFGIFTYEGAYLPQQGGWYWTSAPSSLQYDQWHTCLCSRPCYKGLNEPWMDWKNDSALGNGTFGPSSGSAVFPRTSVYQPIYTRLRVSLSINTSRTLRGGRNTSARYVFSLLGVKEC